MGAWAWGVAYALPAIGLVLAFKYTSGWVSTSSFVLLLAYVGVGLGYALVTELRAWGEMEDELDGRDCEDDQ